MTRRNNNMALTIHTRMTPHMAGSLIAAANVVLNHPELRGIGWDGTQMRTLRLARDRFESDVIDTWGLSDTNTKNTSNG